MRVKTISYQKSFVIGPYLQEKIGVEVEISETDSPIEVFLNAKTQVEEWHRATNPGLYYEAPYKPIPIEGVPDSKEERIAIIVKDIERCSSLNDLKGYHLLTRTSQSIQEAYDKKLKELS